MKKENRVNYAGKRNVESAYVTDRSKVSRGSIDKAKKVKKTLDKYKPPSIEDPVDRKEENKIILQGTYPLPKGIWLPAFAIKAITNYSERNIRYLFYAGVVKGLVFENSTHKLYDLGDILVYMNTRSRGRLPGAVTKSKFKKGTKKMKAGVPRTVRRTPKYEKIETRTITKGE